MEEKKRTKPDFTAIYRDIPKKWLVVLWAAVAVIALALCFEYSLRSVAREMAEGSGRQPGGRGRKLCSKPKWFPAPV